MATHSLHPAPVSVAPWRDRTATVLMLLAAVGACVAFVSSISTVAAAGPATQVVEIWRLYGFIVFTGLYVLLAFWPRRYPGVWELAILDKAALGVTGLVLLGRGVGDAQTILIFDGSLAVITLMAYLLAKGYTGWARVQRLQRLHAASPLPRTNTLQYASDDKRGTRHYDKNS